MAVDRAHQVRVVVVPEPPAALAPVRTAVRRVLGAGWQVQRLTAGSRMLVVTGESAATVGSDEHARESHEAALTLIRSGRFRRVEADVPVPAFEERQGVGAFGGNQCGDDSTPLDWAHKTVRWQQAMDLMSAATRGGVGIRIGHPDSGYTLHPNLGAAALDLTTDRDVIDNDDDAVDDLTPNPLWPLPNPGHGTATASVIVGRGTAAAGIVGLAPAAVLVPIRATESVVQLFDSDVARAVAHARVAGCHIVSMSLGGKGFFGLEDEIQKAVDSGIIVMAAAGNHVLIVTAPASYANCLAVAATGPGDSRWDGSSRGPAVDVSMPGACVHNASYDNNKQPGVSRSSGTSYAVAHLAGAAALWLAHHGHAQLVTTFGAKRVQAAFLAVLRWPGVCVVPAGWDIAWGIGRVDLPALLQAPLPTAAELAGVGAFGATESDAVGRIAASIGVEPVLVRTRLAARLGADTPEELARLLVEHEGELVYLTLVDTAFADSLVQPGGVGAFAPAPLVGGVSAELAGRLGG
jgi:subtilisin family serine protease